MKHFLYVALAVMVLLNGVLLFQKTNYGGLNAAYADQSGEKGLTDFETPFVKAAEKIRPSVVTIINKREVRQLPMRQTQPFPFGHFWGGDLHRFFENLPRRQMQQGLGSGVIVDRHGYVLTNNHVIKDADQLMVQLHDGKEYEAEVVGTDPKSDLAVIKLDGKDFVAAELGTSRDVRIGQWVLAVGNPFGLTQTVTTGIVSATGRDDVGVAQYENFIQTDAAINQGNSGGPLIDLHGRVIGINTAIMSRGGGNDGIGMTIPIDMAESIMTQLISDGAVYRGWLGVGIQDLTEDLAASFDFEGKGVLVSTVMEDSPAEKAGLKEGDIIQSMDGVLMHDGADLRNQVAQMRPGSKVSMKIFRDGKAKTMSVELGEMPGEFDGENPSAHGKPDKLGIVLHSPSEKVRQHFKLPNDVKGGVITSVERNSIAARAGLRPGDVIIQVGDEKVDSASEAVRQLKRQNMKDGIRLRVLSGSMHRFVFLKSPK